MAATSKLHLSSKTPNMSPASSSALDCIRDLYAEEFDLILVFSMLYMLRAIISTNLSVDIGNGDLFTKVLNWFNRFSDASTRSSVLIWVKNMPWMCRNVLMNLLLRSAIERVSKSWDEDSELGLAEVVLCSLGPSSFLIQISRLTLLPEKLNKKLNNTINI